MGLWDWLGGLFGGGLSVGELAARLKAPETELRRLEPAYQEIALPKRSGGVRRIAIPSPPLKAVQRRILRRLLKRLGSHPAANGFEPGRSIVTNAMPHVGKAVVIRLDIKDFFTSTKAERVYRFFRDLGWSREAAKLLGKLCTWQGGLPQGAPTSPRLSNLVNRRIDLRLAAFADSIAGEYTRYADDLTFSFAFSNRILLSTCLYLARRILREEGYRLQGRKLSVRRGHDRQVVTGLVVNERVQLPRNVRRWLRAVEHHVAQGRPITLTSEQLAGWRSLRDMVETQSRP